MADESLDSTVNTSSSSGVGNVKLSIVVLGFDLTCSLVKRRRNDLQP